VGYELLGLLGFRYGVIPFIVTWPDSRIIQNRRGFHSITREPRVLVERRKSTRFRLRYHVTCTWFDESGFSNTITSIARDVSSAGSFIISQDWPTPGTLAQIEIRLPSRGPSQHGVKLQGTGRVVRLVQDGEQAGFAVAAISSWSISRSYKQVAIRA